MKYRLYVYRIIFVYVCMLACLHVHCLCCALRPDESVLSTKHLNVYKKQYNFFSVVYSWDGRICCQIYSCTDTRSLLSYKFSVNCIRCGLRVQVQWHYLF